MLTSRECSKVLGGLVGALCTHVALDPAGIREAVRACAESDRLWGLVDRLERAPPSVEEMVGEARALQGEGATAELRTAYRALGGLVSGLRSTASRRSVRTAFRWWAETDAAWECWK